MRTKEMGCREMGFTRKISDMECPECGNELCPQEGCFLCPSCGYQSCH